MNNNAYVIARDVLPRSNLRVKEEIASLGLDPERAQGVVLRYSTGARNDIVVGDE